MSAINHTPHYRLKVQYMSTNLDRAIGFINGVMSSILLGIIFVYTVMGNGVTWQMIVLALGAMTTLLLLNGIPINSITFGKFRIDFEVTNGDDEQSDSR
jgi:hypothetical protein